MRRKIIAIVYFDDMCIGILSCIAVGIEATAIYGKNAAVIEYSSWTRENDKQRSEPFTRYAINCRIVAHTHRATAMTTNVYNGWEPGMLYLVYCRSVERSCDGYVSMHHRHQYIVAFERQVTDERCMKNLNSMQQQQQHAIVILAKAKSIFLSN